MNSHQYFKLNSEFVPNLSYTPNLILIQTVSMQYDKTLNAIWWYYYKLFRRDNVTVITFLEKSHVFWGYMHSEIFIDKISYYMEFASGESKGWVGGVDERKLAMCC